MAFEANAGNLLPDRSLDREGWAMSDLGELTERSMAHARTPGSRSSVLAAARGEVGSPGRGGAVPGPRQTKAFGCAAVRT
jgi:hypothetical protein